MKKSNQKKINLQKAIQNLKNSVSTPPLEDRDYGGIIKAFETTYELLWKTLKAILEENGIQAPFPRIVFEEAFKAGLIEGNEIWKEMMEARNMAAHTYDKAQAILLTEKITNKFVNHLEKAFNKLNR